MSELFGHQPRFGQRLWQAGGSGGKHVPNAAGRPGVIVVELHARVFSGLRLPGWTTALQPCTLPGQAVSEEPLGGFCMPSLELGQWQGNPAIGY